MTNKSNQIKSNQTKKKEKLQTKMIKIFLLNVKMTR